MEYNNIKLSEVQSTITQLDSLEPTSVESMMSSLDGILGSGIRDVISHANTNSVIHVFDKDGSTYGLKSEFGEAQVTRTEAAWYKKAPQELCQHFVAAGNHENMAYVLMRWLEGSPVLESRAISAETEADFSEVADAWVNALSIDEQLFRAYPVKQLDNNADSSFFKDKFMGKVEQARPHKYLHDILTAEEVEVNGKRYEGPTALIDRVHKDAALLNYLSPSEAGFIHGDLHADNIMLQDGQIFTIDPNGLDFLPIEYDHGRVIWSLTGWNAITRRHEHQISKQGDLQYALSVPVRPAYTAALSAVRNYFEAYGQRKGLAPNQAWHRAVYSSAMQYMSRADHAAIEHEASALHLMGIMQLSDLLDELANVDVSAVSPSRATSINVGSTMLSNV